MKFVLFAALACLAPVAAVAQDAPAAAAQPASTAKFNLDTPIETLVADAAAKAVLDADFGGDVTQNPNYDGFKSMSLHQVQPFAPDKLPDSLLSKIETDLAAIK